MTPPPTTDPPYGTAASMPAMSTDPLLGQTLAGRYHIQRKLGEGGMGAVYLATHNVLEKQVALKVLHGEFARKPDLVERFMQEAKAASRIRHENVIDISDFGTTSEGLFFFAMELLTGHDLHEEIARARMAGQLLPWARSKKIFLQICAALSAAHALGIVHRDLKPENIYLVEFLGDPDFVKLLDFGIAKLTEVGDGDRKLTRTGMLFGTPEYMSPEQARGEPIIDKRVDVYAMGCILFQLVTGRVPFEAENFMGVLSLHLTEPPPAIPPEVFDSIGAPRGLAGVIDRALAKDREQRFPSIDELSRAIRRASGDKTTGQVVTQPSVPAPANTVNPRSRTPAGGTGLRTEWTGNLSVPEVEPPAPPRASRLPAILVGAGIAVAAAVVAVVMTRPDAPPVSPGSAAVPAAPPIASAPAQPAAPAPAPAVPAPAAPPPLSFERATIRIESVPSGAEVRDLANNNVVLGRTPFKFTLPASRTARSFALRHRGYVDAFVDVTPDQPKIDHTEKLVPGASGTTPPVRRPDTPQIKPPPAAPAAPAAPAPAAPAPEPPPVQPPPAAPTAAAPAPAAPAAPAPAAPATPRPDDDCGDPPCLKADPSRPGRGSAE